MKFIPQQFTWDQSNDQVNILFHDKYFEFCWHGSCSIGEFPPLKKKDIQVIITKDAIAIKLSQFSVLAFQGVLKELILPDESSWDYIPQIGIKVILQKRNINTQWIFPFSVYEKEMYYKNFKTLRLIESQYENPFLQQINPLQESFNQINNLVESSFEALRNNGFTKEFYLNWWKSQEPQNKKDVFIKLNQLDPDVILKKDQFTKQSFINMNPIFMSELEFGVNEKKFILVQALTDSLIGTSNSFLIQDPYQTTNRLFIYQFNTFRVKSGTWILIKEPYIKFGARDHVPMIRIDNPDDMILFPNEILFDLNNIQFSHEFTSGQAERIQSVADSKFQGMIFNVDSKQLTFTIMVFYSKAQDFNKGQQNLYIEQDQDIWIAASIEKLKMITKNCFEIQLSKSFQSELFIECLKNKIEKTPGKNIILWREQNTNVQDILQYIYYTNNIPLKLIDQFLPIATQQVNGSKYLISELFKLFHQEKENIISKKILKKCKKIKTQENDLFLQNEINKRAITKQIDNILVNYNNYKKNSQQKKTFLQEVEKEINIIDPNKIEYQDKNYILDQQLSNLCQQTQLINERNILENLLKENDIEIINTSLYYLKKYVEKFNDDEKYLDSKVFSNSVIKNKMCENEFKLDVVLKSLSLLTFEYDSQIVEKILRQKEKKRMQKKLKKKQKEKDSIIDQLGGIENNIMLVQQEEDIKSITEEFSNNQIQDECASDQQDLEDIQEKIQLLNDLPINQDIFQGQIQNNSQKYIKTLQNEENKDSFQDDQSIQSLLTVHSKSKNQKQNNHWKERIEERYNIDTSKKEIKDELLSNLKQILKEESTEVMISKRDSNRILVQDKKNDIQFILAKTNEVQNGKAVYIPITVLSQNMKFK